MTDSPLTGSRPVEPSRSQRRSSGSTGRPSAVSEQTTSSPSVASQSSDTAGSLYRAEVEPRWKQGKPKPARKRPLRQFSEKKKATFDVQDYVRRRVFDRDGGCLMDGIGPCMGRLTVHHRRKASQGGSFTMRNLVTMCFFHNWAIEQRAELAAYAHSVGLVVRRGDPEWESLGRAS